jgi:hypothetical protein
MLSRGATRLFNLIQNFIVRYRRPFFASQAWIKTHLKCSMRSVQRWFAELIAGGFIAQKRRSQRTAVCSILRPILAGQMAGQMAGRYKEEPTVRFPRRQHIPYKPQGRAANAIEYTQQEIADLEEFASAHEARRLALERAS